MAMRPTDFGGAVAVDGYGPGFFRVGGEVFHGPVLVTDGGGQGWGGLDDTDALLALSGRVDVLFLGMGDQIAHPPRDLVEPVPGAALQDLDLCRRPVRQQFLDPHDHRSARRVEDIHV